MGVSQFGFDGGPRHVQIHVQLSGGAAHRQRALDDDGAQTAVGCSQRFEVPAAAGRPFQVDRSQRDAGVAEAAGRHYPNRQPAAELEQRSVSASSIVAGGVLRAGESPGPVTAEYNV